MTIEVGNSQVIACVITCFLYFFFLLILYNPAITYSVWPVLSEKLCEVTSIQLDHRKLLGVKDLGLTNQTGTTEGKVLLVRFGQFSFRHQSLIHPLTDSTVGPVGTDNNVSFKSVLVGQVNGDPVVLLADVKNSMAKVDLVGRDLFEDKVVEFRASNNVLSISCAENTAAIM